MKEFTGILSQVKGDYLSEINKMLGVSILPDHDCPLHALSSSHYAFGKTQNSFDQKSEDRFIIEIQGKIYNLKELQNKLKEQGQLADNLNANALLLLAYQAWGTSFLSLLDGNFILFIFDKKEKKLLLARDKVGTHRLFWGRFKEKFLFASSLKSLLCSKYVPQRPCLESIASYLYLGYFPQDKSPVSGINCLLPGYYLLVDAEQQIILNKYWSMKETPDSCSMLDQQGVNAQFEQLLTKAIEKRNPDKKSLSLYLSGDLGSAALMHFSKKLGYPDPYLYCNQFQNQDSNLYPFAEHLTSRYGGSIEKQELSCDALFDTLAQIVWHLDEPVADPNSVLIWDLANHLSSKTDSIITSLGSVEFLGSHSPNNSMAYEPLFGWFLQLMRPAITKVGVPLMFKLNKKSAFKALKYFQKDFWANDYIMQNALYQKAELKKLSPILHREFDFDIYIQQTYQYLKYIHSQNFNISDYFFYDAETTLSNFLVVQYQNILHAKGIELSTPFLDQDLITFLIHTPEQFKSSRKKPMLPMQPLFEQTLDPNFSSYQLNKSIHYLNNWFHEKRVLEIFTKLKKGTLCESGIISVEYLSQILTTQPCKKRQFEKIWSLLILEIWFQLFMNRPVYSYPETSSLSSLRV